MGVFGLLNAPVHAWPPMCLWRLELQPEPTPAPAEVFPHIRLDRAARTVEFDARIAINAHALDGSVVFLEVIACRPDTKEHESLVVTDAEASHIHAALLLLNLEPGHPGGWRWEGQTLLPISPEGDAVRVSISWTDDQGVTQEHLATDLMINRADGRAFTEFLLESPASADDQATGDPPSFHVFAGSRFVIHEGREVYDADGAGLIVGVHTFGSEVVALSTVLSHEASVLEPEWIASRDLLPVRDTPVVVRLIAETPPRPDTPGAPNPQSFMAP